MENIKSAQRASLVAIVLILILTVLEFPAPVGFETRPQDNVSLVWLIFFLIILTVEIAAIPLIFKISVVGGWLGMSAAALNIIQVAADQMHLMQPEVVPMTYLLLEDAVGVASLVLAYFSWKILTKNR